MGKISDAFERQRKETVLKLDRDLEEQFVGPSQDKSKTEAALVLQGHDRVNGKLVVVSARDSADAENFRFLRSHIFSGKNGDRPKTIMVTSAFPGEGKTFVASNLAASSTHKVSICLVKKVVPPGTTIGSRRKLD